MNVKIQTYRTLRYPYLDGAMIWEWSAATRGQFVRTIRSGSIFELIGMGLAVGCWLLAATPSTPAQYYNYTQCSIWGRGLG